VGWIPVFRVPPPQMAAPSRLYAYEVEAALLDQEEQKELAGRGIPVHPTEASIPSQHRRTHR